MKSKPGGGRGREDEYMCSCIVTTGTSGRWIQNSWEIGRKKCLVFLQPVPTESDCANWKRFFMI